MAILCAMAADIVPIRLGLTKGDLYTLWAPRWRDEGDEWEAFLGKDEDLYAFESVADLAAFVRTNTDNDLTDHPAWQGLTEANAHTFDPPEDRQYDLVSLEELVAEKPSEETVKDLHRTLAIASCIGSVCEMPAITKFFNGNPVLGTVGGGIDAFAGRPGRKRWAEIETVIGRGWDNVVDAIDEIVTIPDVDKAASEKAEAELAEPAPEPEESRRSRRRTPTTSTIPTTATTKSRRSRCPRRGPGAGQRRRLLAQGRHRSRADDDQRRHVLHPAVLSRRPTDLLGPQRTNQRVHLERTLARYLADEHDHDLSDLATYDDIRTAATDGSLQVNVSDDNVYVLTGIADDLAEGPDAIDRDQLELAVELLRDVGEYAEDTIVDESPGCRSAAGPGGGACARPGHRPPPQPAVCKGRRAVGGAGGVRRFAAAPGVALQLRRLRVPRLVQAEFARRRAAGCWSTGPSPGR